MLMHRVEASCARAAWAGVGIMGLKISENAGVFGVSTY